MKRIKIFVKKNYIILIPFLTTFFLYLINIIVNKIYPFGDETFIYSDMGEQYSIYFNYIRDMILSGDSLFSSFSFSLGQNFYGIFTYFCSSPLNIIFLLSTKATMPIFILILVLLKISLASLNMAILLRTKLKNNLSIFIFSVLYGLMSYNLIYSVNIMWLDPMYLLPLIVLGLEKMLDGKPILYVVSLTLAICSNYYTAFPVCIFMIIYFIYYNLLSKEKFWKKTLIFIKYSVIAVLLSSVILIPTVFNMLDGKFQTTDADFSFKIMYNPIFLIYKFLVSDFKVLMEDMPHITSSLLVLVFTITYIFNKNITLKDKIYTIFTVALLIGITVFAATDTIMHCFRLPNQFTYRYAFIISFFLILISSKNFDEFNVSKKNLIMYLFVGYIIFKYLKLYIDFKTVVSSTLVLIYFTFSTFIKNKKMLSIFIIPFLMGELLINVSESFNEISRDSYKLYSTTYKYIDEIEALKPKQDEFYRIYGTKFTLNDALLYKYYGISSFSPTISVNSNKLLKDYFGEPLVPSYAIDYLVSTDFTDSFLNVKYKYKTEKEFEVAETKNVFPFLYRITKNDRFKESKSLIENQNSIYQHLTDSDDNLFEKNDDYSVSGCVIGDDNVVVTASGYCKFISTKKSGKRYFEIDSESFDIIPSYDGMMTNEYYGAHIIFDLSKSNTLFINPESVKLDYIGSYEMNEDKLVRLSEKLNANGVNITSHSQSKVTGHIFNDEDNQMIFTTIPYDDGWHVEINGEEVKTFKNLNSLLAFDLPKGESNIKMYFIPKGYIIGLTISLLTFDILVAIYVIKNKEH